MTSSSSSVVTITRVKDHLDQFLGLPNSLLVNQNIIIFQRTSKNLTSSEEASNPEVNGNTLVYPKAYLIVILISPSSFTPNDPYCLIQDYVNFSQASDFGVKILKVCKINRFSENQDMSTGNVTLNSNRRMLWHATKPDRVRSILEKGLLKPNSSRHRRFGNGIYFADRIAKSSRYCSSSVPNVGEIGYLFLCEVQLGKVFETIKLGKLAEFRYDSVKYVGGLMPDDKGNREVGGVIWPLGASVNRLVVWLEGLVKEKITMSMHSMTRAKLK